MSPKTLRFLQILNSFQVSLPSKSCIMLLSCVKLKILLALPQNAHKRMMTSVDVTEEFLEEIIKFQEEFLLHT